MTTPVYRSTPRAKKASKKKPFITFGPLTGEERSVPDCVTYSNDSMDVEMRSRATLHNAKAEFFLSLARGVETLTAFGKHILSEVIRKAV